MLVIQRAQLFVLLRRPEVLVDGGGVAFLGGRFEDQSQLFELFDYGPTGARFVDEVLRDPVDDV